MSKSGLLIVGAAGHASVVAEAAQSSGRFDLLGFFETRPSADLTAPVAGLEVLRGPEALAGVPRESVQVVVAIGENACRIRVAKEFRAAGFDLATVIHARAIISPSARVGPGTVAMAGVVVNARTEVGENVILNTASTVDHDCTISDGVHLSPGVHLGGWVTVGLEAWIGVGASVRDRVQIGAGAIVGVGAAVVFDIPEGVVAYGVPARVRRRREVAE